MSVFKLFMGLLIVMFQITGMVAFFEGSVEVSLVAAVAMLLCIGMWCVATYTLKETNC